MSKRTTLATSLALFIVLLLIAQIRAEPRSSFIIDGADATAYLTTTESSELIMLIAGVPPRFVVESANAMRYYNVAPVPADLETLLGQIGVRFVIEYANANRFYGSTYPVALISDTVPPQISGTTSSSAGANSVSITWQTNEFATSTVRYGTQPGNYPHTITDNLYRTQHTITLSGLVVGGKYYYRVSSTDRSGNTSQSPEYQFTMPLRVYLPLVRR
jgi:hypothetical protein